MADKRVIIYSTPTCPYCKKAKEYLIEKGIKFTDYDVAANHSKAQEMIQKSGQMAVPVIVIGEEIVVGFDQGQLDKVLSL
ncbi:glutaredoxin family protein [Chloroflexota bacterium]